MGSIESTQKSPQRRQSDQAKKLELLATKFQDAYSGRRTAVKNPLATIRRFSHKAQQDSYDRALNQRIAKEATELLDLIEHGEESREKTQRIDALLASLIERIDVKLFD